MAVFLSADGMVLRGLDSVVGSVGGSAISAAPMRFEQCDADEINGSAESTSVGQRRFKTLT